MVENVVIPTEYANDPGMREAYLMSLKANPDLPAPPPPPADPPAPPPPPADPPAPSPPPVISVDEHNSLKDKYESALSEIEVLRKKSEVPTKIIDPDLYRLAIIKEKTPDKFSTFAAIKISKNADPFSLLIEDYILKNPEYKDARDKVASFLRNQYGLDKPIPDPLDPANAEDQDISERNSEIEAAQRLRDFGEMRMKGDAKAVMEKLESEFNAIELPESSVKSPEQIAKEVKSAQEGWTPVVEKVFDTLKSISIYTQSKDAKDPVEFLSFDIPVDLVPQYKKQFVDFCVSKNIPLTQEGVAKAASVFVDSFKRDNEARIMDAVVAKARKLTEIEYDSMYTNPSFLKEKVDRRETPIETPYEKSRREAAELEGVKFK